MDFATVLITSILLGVAATYPLRALILEQKERYHEGPFASEKRHVYFAEDGYVQRVALFDWIRRAAGVYRVEKNPDGSELWVVVEDKAARFTCTFCLSWWVSFIFSAIFYYHYRMPIEWLFAVHCIIAVISQVFYSFLFEKS